jgi:hypothetical protein
VFSCFRDQTELVFESEFLMLDRYVTVAAFQDPMAATMAKNYLEEKGIPAILLDETTVATDWLLSGAIGGVKVQVLPIHVERAEMLLVQAKAEDEEIDVDTHREKSAIVSREIAEDLAVEREDQAPINQLVDRLFRVVVFGLLFWPLQFYALILLYQLMQMPGTVSDNRRWKAWASFVLAPIFAVGTCLGVCSFSLP